MSELLFSLPIDEATMFKKMVTEKFPKIKVNFGPDDENEGVLFNVNVPPEGVPMPVFWEEFCKVRRGRER